MKKLDITKDNQHFLFSGPLGTVTLDTKKFDLGGFHSYKLVNPNDKNDSQIIWKFVKQSSKQQNLLIRQEDKGFLHSKKKGFTYNTIKNFLNGKNLEIDSNMPIYKKNHNFQKTHLESLCDQKSKGISRGFFVYLKIVGIGYRVFLEKENLLTFKLGYSHYYQAELPKSIKVFLPEPTLICLYGIDKNQVTQVAAKIQAIKKPCVYKGKGIRLIDQQIQLKAAKKK